MNATAPFTAAVVVHHRSPDTVARTVELLAEQGISPERLILVDNSEDELQLRQLRQSLAGAAQITAIDNRGYGHAANTGIERVLGIHPRPSFVLVATHEAMPQPGAIAALEDAMTDDPALGAAGPTLISTVRGQGERVTSGGKLTWLLNEPRHVPPPADRSPGAVAKRKWIDGSFVLYRLEVLERLRFREDFFLYYEETELHARIIESGWEIGCVTDAKVLENSSGVPPELRGRNLQWYQQLHGNRFQRAVTVPFLIVKAVTKAVLARQGLSEAAAMSFGWRRAVRHPVRTH